MRPADEQLDMKSKDICFVAKVDKFNLEEFKLDNLRRAGRELKLKSKVVVVCGYKFWQPYSDQQFRKLNVFEEHSLSSQQEINKFCLNLAPLESEGL